MVEKLVDADGEEAMALTQLPEGGRVRITEDEPWVFSGYTYSGR